MPETPESSSAQSVRLKADPTRVAGSGFNRTKNSLIRWTLSFVRPYRHRVSIILVLLLAEVGLTALQPWPLKIVIDFVLEGRPIPEPLAGWLRALHGGDALMMLVVFAIAGVALQISNYVIS